MLKIKNDFKFGKYEMEMAAKQICDMAVKLNTWQFHICLYRLGLHNSPSKIEFDSSMLCGIECLIGYKWLEFDDGEEAWIVTPEFIDRVSEQ